LVAKEARNKKIFELWLAFYTQEETAKLLDSEQSSVDHTLPESADLPQSAKPLKITWLISPHPFIMFFPVDLYLLKINNLLYHK